MEIPDFGSGIFDVVARTTIVYVVLLLLLRVGGKRKVGQLSIPDLVLVLLIANGVQNAMVGQNTEPRRRASSRPSRWSSWTASRTSSSRARTARARSWKASRGSSSTTASSCRARCKEEDVTEGDLLGAIRQHGLRGLEDVGLAVLETNGSISIIPRDPSLAPAAAAPPPGTG